MLIQIGEKVHVITRRLFEGDLRRHFVGIVTGADGSALRLSGFAFVFDDSLNDFLRQDERRERVFGLTDAGLVINVLPANANLDTMHYTSDDERRRILTDGETFSFNINEFGINR